MAVSYFHMVNNHTIIGAKRFHFRIRDGIGWFTFAITAKKTFKLLNYLRNLTYIIYNTYYYSYNFQNTWVLYGQVARSISTG